jgi:hypothetical protein
METGVLARNGEPIFFGDVVESVQGTVFNVVSHPSGPALEVDGGFYELEAYMSPNLWIVNKSNRRDQSAL